MEQAPIKQASIKLYGIPIGPYVRKVAVTLRLKELPFDLVPVMPGDGSDSTFKAISPLLKVPAFSDGELNLADSSVICEYLEDVYPDFGVYPIDPVKKAHARWLEEYADSKIVSVCGPGIFFERVVKPGFMGQPSDEEVVAANINNDMPPVLDYLESQLGELIGDRSEGPVEYSYLFGAITVPDIAIATHFINAHYAGFDVDSDRWPQLASYLTRVWEQPAFAEEIAHGFPVMEGLLSKAGLAA